MTRRLLIVALAAVAGFGLGGLSSGARRAGGGTVPKTVEKKREGVNGAGDPREVALGTALTELRQTSGDLRGLASLGAALVQLDSKQIARLLEQLERDDSRQHDDRLAWLFTWWLKRDPTAAAGWIRPRLDAMAQDGPAGITFSMDARGKLVLAWAQADPQAALEYARGHARTGLATALLRKVMSAWPDRDDRHRLALLLDFPAGTARSTALYELHRSWANRDPAAAFASARALEPSRERDKAINDVLVAWAERDAAAAFAQYRALGLSDSVLLSNVLAKGAAKNPAQALEWLQQLDAPQIARCAPKIIEAWAQKDPATALGWALANGVRLSPRHEGWFRIEHNGFGRSSTSSNGFISPLGKALEKQPEATLAWLRSLPAGSDRDRLTELAVAASRDREQALALFSTLPAEAAARTARNVAFRFTNDPERGREWAMNLPVGPMRAEAWTGLGALSGNPLDLPPGPDRDAMLSGTLHRSGFVPKPAERIETMLQIGDPVLRRDMIEELMESCTRNEYRADEARAALEKANVPEKWKQRWRMPAAPTP